MITEPQVEAALDYLRDKAREYGKAKADRVYLEQFRKSKKAILMNHKVGEPEHVRASYAYAHAEYLEILDGIKAATEIEIELLWRMKAAELKTEIWRTQQANNRRIDSSHR